MHQKASRCHKKPGIPQAGYHVFPNKTPPANSLFISEFTSMQPSAHASNPIRPYLQNGAFQVYPNLLTLFNFPACFPSSNHGVSANTTAGGAFTHPLLSSTVTALLTPWSSNFHASSIAFACNPLARRLCTFASSTALAFIALATRRDASSLTRFWVLFRARTSLRSSVSAFWASEVTRDLRLPSLGAWRREPLSMGLTLGLGIGQLSISCMIRSIRAASDSILEARLAGVDGEVLVGMCCSGITGGLGVSCPPVRVRPSPVRKLWRREYWLVGGLRVIVDRAVETNPFIGGLG